jgi:hypothetical protein
VPSESEYRRSVPLLQVRNAVAFISFSQIRFLSPALILPIGGKRRNIHMSQEILESLSSMAASYGDFGLFRAAPKDAVSLSGQAMRPEPSRGGFKMVPDLAPAHHFDQYE